MENSIEEIIKIIERKIKEAEHYTDITGLCLTLDKELCNAFINILSDYKRVLKENEELNNRCRNLDKEAQAYLEELAGDNTLTRRTIKQLQEENEELKKDYYNIINKIENKIDRFDYEFEKAKRQNDKDKSDYYWDLIINFKKMLESEE